MDLGGAIEWALLFASTMGSKRVLRRQLPRIQRWLSNVPRWAVRARRAKCEALAQDLTVARNQRDHEAARAANLLRLKREIEAHRDAHHVQVRAAERRRVVDAIAKWVSTKSGDRELADSIRERWGHVASARHDENTP
jgi:hypothetical protein